MMSIDPKIKSCSHVTNFVYFYLSLSICPIKFLAFIAVIKKKKGDDFLYSLYFLSSYLQFILQTLKMSMQFFYEDGQGHVVDENGVEPMDLVVDEELFAIETISSRTQFLMNKPPERPSNPVILPVTDERNSEDVDTEQCNKRGYAVLL